MKDQSFASPRLDGACNRRRSKFTVSTGPLSAEGKVVMNIADQADAIFLKMSPDDAEALGKALVAQAHVVRSEGEIEYPTSTFGKMRLMMARPEDLPFYLATD